MENLTFVLVLLDHTSQEESRLQRHPGTEGAQTCERLLSISLVDPRVDKLFPSLTRGDVFKGSRPL